MKNQSFLKRFRFALAGWRHAFRAEKSFRSQVLFALGAMVLLIYFRPDPIWWALFSFAIGSVLSAELFNTALETILDLLHPNEHLHVKIAKDCAAGAVLIFSVVALVILVCFLIHLCNG